MPHYVKCNEKTYRRIGAPLNRVRTKDGCYLAWQADFTCFPEWPDMNAVASRTGSLLLQPTQAREEQDGSVLRPLPVATDEDFVMETAPDDSAIDDVEPETPVGPEQTEQVPGEDIAVDEESGTDDNVDTEGGEE